MEPSEMSIDKLPQVKQAPVRHALRRREDAPWWSRFKSPAPKFAPTAWWEVMLALGIAALAAWLGWLWIEADKAPLFEHSGRFIRNSVVMWTRFNDGQGVRPDAYPPLAYWVSCICYDIWGLSRQVAIGSQLVFYLPYVLGCWWLGRYVGGRWGGLLAALAAAGNLWFALHLHGYFLEVALTAWVSCALAFLVASHGCRKIVPTLGLGVTLGLGMLTKWVFALFVVPAVLWPLCVAWGEGPRSRRLAAVGLLAVLVTLVAVYVAWGKEFWYFPKEYYIVSLNAWLIALAVAVYSMVRRGWQAGGGLTVALCLGGILSSWWYFLSIQELQVKAAGDFAQHTSAATSFHLLGQSLTLCYWMAPIFAVAGLIYGLYRAELRVCTFLALGAIVPAFVFYVFAKVPIGPRYLLPSTALMLVLAFAWLGRFRYVRVALAVGLAVITGVQLGGYMAPPSWGIDSMTEDLRLEATPADGLLIVPAPDTQAAPVAELTRYMLEQLDQTGESRFTAAIMPNSRLDVDMLMLEALLQGRFIDIEHYLPGRTQAVPLTSMVLAIGGEERLNLATEGEWAKSYELVKTWDEGRWGVWDLYRHPTKLDMRPLPGVTSGPPRNAATVE